MIEPIKLGEYKPRPFLRTYLGGPAKCGKTTTALTFFEGDAGRVVDSPAHVHLFSFDPGTPRVIEEFAAKKPWVNDISLYDFEWLANTEDGAGSFFTELCTALDKLGVQSRQGKLGHAAVFFAGAGAMAEGLIREVRLTVGSLDPDKMDKFYRWTVYGNRLDLVRAKAHALRAHVVWEFTVMKWSESEDAKESHLVQGRQSGLLGAALEQAFKLDLLAGTRSFDTRPGWHWMRTSRREVCLPPRIQPADFSLVCKLLGYELAEEKKP